MTLIQEGVLIDEKAAAPYFSCAGFVWSQLISQKKETWEKIIPRRTEKERFERAFEKAEERVKKTRSTGYDALIDLVAGSMASVF